MDLRIITTQADLNAALALRHEVFVQEQGVSRDLEVDEFDPLNAGTTHVIACHEHRAVGTGRLRWLEAGVGKLERLAVIASERNQGVGRAITAFLEQIAKERGVQRLLLNSQQSARGFYEKLDYSAEGELFIEANIVHIAMNKTLT